MRNILYLIIMIVAVGLSVAYSVNIFKGKDITEPPVTIVTPQQAQPKIKLEPLKPQDFIPAPGFSSDEDLYNRIDTLERNLNMKLAVIAESSDNKEVLSRFDQLSKELEADVTMMLSTINKKEQWYRNEFYQLMIGLGAVFVFITAFILVAYSNLKKLILKNQFSGGLSQLSKAQAEVATPGEAGNPVLTAVNNVSVRLAELIAENRYLFDADKATRLSPSQKNALTEITDEILFLDKAGCPTSDEEYYLLGLERFTEKSYEESGALFEHIKEDDDSFSLAWFMTGYTSYLDRKFDEAEKDFARACELEPMNPTYLVNYGNVCLKLKKYSEAAQTLSKAVEHSGGDATLWNNLAHAYILSGDAEKAAEAFKKACELRPDFNEAAHNLGLTYSRLGRYEDAAAAFEKAIEIKPDKHESMYNAACVYAIMKNREKALEHLKKAVTLSPDYAEKARSDKDFSAYADDPEFKEAVK